MNCNTDDPNKKCEKPESKQPERVTLPKNAEIESIKRTLYNAIDKLDRLTAK